ncbi:hypothetical protein [Mycobacterium spongiae]|nr:hypothetical protein [Mycobacterium spongiae]
MNIPQPTDNHDRPAYNPAERRPRSDYRRTLIDKAGKVGLATVKG